MDMTSFWSELDARINKYDLLCHDFYKAWSEGSLTREDLKMYATEYYHHVAAFPNYLAALEYRLPAGATRAAIAENREDELGALSKDRRSHADLWLDFAEGMGAQAEDVKADKPMAVIEDLIAKFERFAGEGSTAEALAAFYAYESQVPRIAKEKAMGLKNLYGATPSAYKYFTVHETADVEHTNVWRNLINAEIAKKPEQVEAALGAAEATAKALWKVLDAVEARRMATRQLVS